MARLDGPPNLLHRAAHSVQPLRRRRNVIELDRRLLRLGEDHELQPQGLAVRQRLGQLVVKYAARVAGGRACP